MQIMVRASDIGRKSFLDPAQHIAKHTHTAALSRELGYMGAGWAAREGSFCQDPHLLRKWPSPGLGPRGLLFGLCTETLLMYSIRLEWAEHALSCVAVGAVV